MKIVIAPDSFKGSLAALPVAQAIAEGLRSVWPQADIAIFPMADGGEGTLDAVLFARQGQTHRATVSDANGVARSVSYGILQDEAGTIAILEAAQIVGLAQAGASDVMQRSTAGVGELMLHCLAQNIRRFMIGVGGTSTNDGGAGMLAALGVGFLNRAGAVIDATPEGMTHLHQVDVTLLDARLKACAITLMADVDNPLCGQQGATAVFGPQKGVAENQIAALDRALAHYAQLTGASLDADCSTQPGAGAAGGLGYALLLLGATRRPGAEMLCELMRLDEALRDADWVITGEGKSDAQTLHGKLPLVVAQHARRAGVKVFLLSGMIEEASRSKLDAVFNASFSLVGETTSMAQALRETARCLSARARQMALSIPA